MSFESWYSYMTFRYFVKNKFRHILDSTSLDFLKAIEETCSSRLEVISAGTIVFRAQAGYDEKPIIQNDIYVDDIPVAYSEQRMRPLNYNASEGRANPKGIPCLYVASDKETAMSEIRPRLDTIISVAQFKINRELRIIDFSKFHGQKNKFYLKEPDNQQIIESVWQHMDNAFSEPVTNNDQKADYVPTQIIAEYIKSLEYDGIAYKSSLSGGYNLAIFDSANADFITCKLYIAEKVNFDFKSY